MTKQPRPKSRGDHGLYLELLRSGKMLWGLKNKPKDVKLSMYLIHTRMAMQGAVCGNPSPWDVPSNDAESSCYEIKTYMDILGIGFSSFVLFDFVMLFMRSSRLNRHQSIAVSDEGSSSSEQSSSDDEVISTDVKSLAAQGDVPQEFWQVQKLIRYLKIGNLTATIISLCNLADFDLKKEYCQIAIMDAGGLEVLANLLETDNIKCKIGSLKILKDITIHPSIRKSITLMGGIELMITTLSDPNKELQFLSSETLANLAKFRKARKIVRKNNGIPKLIDLLEFDMSNINISKISPDCSDKELPMELRVAKGSAFALWSLSKSKKNKHVIKRSGGLPLIANLFKFKHISLLIPVVGTIQECASEKAFRMVIQSEGMIEHLVKNLKTTSPELKMLCASAIFKMAEENDSRQIVKLHGGLLLNIRRLLNWNILVVYITFQLGNRTSTEKSPEDDKIKEVATPRIKAVENSEALDDLQFNTLKINVLTNVVGALSECADNAVNRESISEGEGLSPLIKLIGTNHSELLVNVSSALGSCAQDKDTLQTIHQKDGVRLLWSLLKNPSEKVQASAAWALSPCIKNAANSGDMVRSFVGGLELMCGLLESKDQQVLAAVCFAIANIAKDKEIWP
ncbi:Armadillo repeat-containing protein gudu,Armadillo repeat-containing protein 4 [Lepeophtheirus salmonis]|uniref:Armadillo repeat-containing protein gudu,Armadillo repeat-containing protein 4 n=1 Tax=Lepeophtheirus salmonis TaxID=72036 RepID=A0A7R8CAA9_LEPSM|nr:Armadillo repeat-containing protein gudu,Armadillo repeat-containing protein 4 [Lepeophtheirus salmonis]CAF2749256.1 Armadillo repeat-containing protein gudu,Armadillo repeat-containing protein 4 [Lepeophtheirus salmonis]